MFEIIRKKIFAPDIALLFVILSLVHFKDFFLSCVNYLNLSFDSQIPLTWDFAAINNWFPYKDIYFPYGILFYLKNINSFLSIIYFLLPTVLFISVYITLKRIFGSKIIAFFSFTSFYLFVYSYTGTENFTRYGIILCFALLSSYIFYKSNLKSKVFFFLGILIGAIFSLAQDQGIYSVLIFILLLVLTPFFKEAKKIDILKFISSKLIVVTTGMVLGFLPFLMFLKLNGMMYEFFLFVKHLPDFTLYAKTPFIPFATSSDNLFTFGSIFIAIVALSYKTFFQKKLSFVSFVEISLVFVLILLEQKNIIRSIDKQITFISFLLYITLFYELTKNKINNFILALFFIGVSLFVLSGFGLHHFINYKLNFEKNLISIFSQNNIQDFLLNKSKLCLNDNLNKFITNKNTKLEKVKKIIENDSKGEFKVFVYLADPIFYVLFNQKPPYYFTIFEATPLYAQRANIKYIEENEVKYVIYNTDALRIQDGVPDYVRSKVLYDYVLNNFKLMDKVENYIIYKK